MSSNFKKGDKFIIELGDRQLDEFEIAGTEYYIKIYLLKQLTPYKSPSAQLTIEPQKMCGYWIDVDDKYNRISGKCSVCGWEAHMYEDDVVGMDYCPNCGADMRGEQNEQTN